MECETQNRLHKLFSVTIPIELTNSNNGQGRGWHKSASDRKKFERILKRLGLVRTPFDVPVIVHVTRILGKGQRMWDASSGLRGNYKALEDACTACGWWFDDSPKYISEVRFFQDKKRRGEGPAVMIEFFC